MPRMRLRRVAALIVLLSVISAWLLGCGSGAESDAGKIVIWEQMDPEERGRFEANLDAFRAQHPELVIEHLPFDTEQLRTQYCFVSA